MERFEFIFWLFLNYNSIDLYQISPTYVIIGASISPTPSPNNTVAEKTSVSVLALYIKIHAIMCGILTRSIARFRPKGSDNHPENKLPKLWMSYVKISFNKLK